MSSAVVLVREFGQYVVAKAIEFKDNYLVWPQKRKFSFIALHYMYLIGTTIIGSILIYPAGGMAYIDSLFFASGASTQSGLNTIDLNKINLYQQIIIYFIAMITNPIFINTFVVFLRLYWFEKRFKHIVAEARVVRASRTRSQARSMNEEGDIELARTGVNGRKITVLRDQGRIMGPPAGFSEKNFATGHKDSQSSDSDEAIRDDYEDSDESNKDSSPEESATHLPGALSPIPENRPPKSENARHIAFVEEQRNPKDLRALRIPGPREADEGAVPEEVDVLSVDEDPHNNDDGQRLPGILKSRTESHTFSIRPNVTIEEPPRPLHSANTTGHRRLPSNPYARPPATPATPVEPSENQSLRKRRTNSFNSLRHATTDERLQSTVSYLSWQPTVGRNSTFFDLTEEQREELGGIEYRSLKTLAVILVCYYVGFHLMGIVVLVPWILRTDFWGQIVDADGVNRVWWGFFSSATLLNDLGFTLTPDSFISFQQAVVVLLLGSFLIVIGNTGFPCMLRFLIWLVSKVVPVSSAMYEEVRFLLDHPRRCFTLMFPAPATWVLFGILIVLNGIDLIFFIILDLNDPVVTGLPPGFRFLDGLFQAVSTRTAGTACVNIAGLHPGIQVSYLIMMYISVFPIAISVRRTNVYEERSLGIYSGQGEEEEDEKEPSYIGAHLRRQLSFDLWYIFLGLFIIAIAEGPRIADNVDANFTLFSCLFEIVSAYGTVGLSLGYPNINASFSAEFTVVSKLVIIAMQIRGRHRGLPYRLDRAILLPSESLHRKEEEDAERRGIRRTSTQNLNSQFDRDANESTNQEGMGAAERTQSRATHASGRDGGSSILHHHRAARKGVGDLMAAFAGPAPNV